MQAAPDFKEWVEQLDFDPSKADPIAVLAVSGGTRQTDNLQVFPELERQEDVSFCCHFSPWQPLRKSPAQNALSQLEGGEKLRIALKFNNPATRLALQVETKITK